MKIDEIIQQIIVARVALKEFERLAREASAASDKATSDVEDAAATVQRLERELLAAIAKGGE